VKTERGPGVPKVECYRLYRTFGDLSFSENMLRIGRGIVSLHLRMPIVHPAACALIRRESDSTIEIRPTGQVKGVFACKAGIW
jgi:hypothetical protein